MKILMDFSSFLGPLVTEAGKLRFQLNLIFIKRDEGKMKLIKQTDLKDKFDTVNDNSRRHFLLLLLERKQMW